MRAAALAVLALLAAPHQHRQEAKSVVFKWAIGPHSVKVPFSLKDIPVPAP
jgi:hypothetical protein